MQKVIVLLFAALYTGYIPLDELVANLSRPCFRQKFHALGTNWLTYYFGWNIDVVLIQHGGDLAQRFAHSKLLLMSLIQYRLASMQCVF